MNDSEYPGAPESSQDREAYDFKQTLNVSPRDKAHGWAPFIWLAYLSFFFIQPILDHAGWKMWFLTALATAIFLVLYFGLFWLQKPRSLLHIGGMVILGLVFAPINGGASTFFVFAAAFVPFCVQTERAGVGLIAGIVALAGIETQVFHLNGWFFFYGGGLAAAVGGSNIYFAQRNRALAKLRMANDEIEHLATVAERERIARDLHDVLGHTLSVIILKSELAGKLMDRDPQRAGNEIREVEQISRQALSEVRDAIRGYRSQGLPAELAKAKATLETAGVSVKCEAAKLTLPAMHESVLSMAVREAVTNVVRHAQARNCSIRLGQRNGSCHLEIEDDGRGGDHSEGNGLRGMRERVEMLGGTLTRDSQAGTRIAINLPLKQTPSKVQTEDCSN
ncbi:MAG TPA: sensor histidine kinase [Candidatus Dormibacteraeota bacterium]|nr:sensor histidine kinase [Candidatus Dormibacteraeota bacterium]